MIEAGRVAVDGRIITELGTKVDPEASVVEVDGERVRIAGPEWVLLHKPPLVVSTRSDPRGRKLGALRALNWKVSGCNRYSNCTYYQQEDNQAHRCESFFCFYQI